MRDKKQHILVTGGAGYIGSHTAKALAARGFTPVAYDNLVHGHGWAVQWGPFVEGDIRDRARLVDTLRRYDISAVLHFAAFAYVGESMKSPALYFENNVTGSLSLLDAVMECGARYVVFSSSCATYGIPDRMPIAEDTPQSPINPYGETKLIVERALRWYGTAYGISWAALRYFNAAGADPDGQLGELHQPETHLIPLVLRATSTDTAFDVFGDDYPTRDGTCVRDYIHVSDLADAHVLALEYLMNGGPSVALNLGTGYGYTVREVIQAAQTVTGREVPHRIASRRPGDPAILVADPARAERVLGWRAHRSALESIVSSAYAWHLHHDRGDRVLTAPGDRHHLNSHTSDDSHASDAERR
jgi:UDP-glucose-4-epimerase GalE